MTPPKYSVSSLSKTLLHGLFLERPYRHHHITHVLKSLHWLKIPDLIHFKILSLTYNSLPPSRPKYLRALFPIQPTSSTRSSSCLALSRLPVPSHLMFSNRA